ncbi:MAG: AraC family transcriptional regulator [Pseudomonadota bacterium]
MDAAPTLCLDETALGEYYAWPLGQPGTLAWRHGEATRVPRPFRVAPYWYAGIVVRRVWDESQTVQDAALEFHGPQTSAFIYHPQAFVEQIGVWIAPELAPAIFRRRCDDLDRADTSDARRQEEGAFQEVMRLARAGDSFHDIAVALDHVIKARLDEMTALDSDIQFVLRKMRSHAETIPVQRLAHVTGLSERQFRRRFQNALGCAPKIYNRVLRLQRVLTELDLFGPPDWADLAHKHGFFDQSHLNREFSDLMGTTPRCVQDERRYGVSDLSNTGTALTLS